MPQKIKATIMASSKTQNYHICEIIYNIYEDNIFQNKKEIKFFSITAIYFIKNIENLVTAWILSMMQWSQIKLKP